MKFSNASISRRVAIANAPRGGRFLSKRCNVEKKGLICHRRFHQLVLLRSFPAIYLVLAFAKIIRLGFFQGVVLMLFREISGLIASLLISGMSLGAGLTQMPDISGGHPLRSLWMMPDGESFIGIESQDVFRWSPQSGRTVVGTMPTSLYSLPVHATAVSDDGSTIIGQLGDGVVGFRWTAPNGAELIPEIPGYDYFRAVPTAVSSDGSVIIGKATYQPLPFHEHEQISFRWTAETGTVPLEGVKYPEAVSDDGTVVVGSTPIGDSSMQAVRWTESTGAVALGLLPESWQPVSNAKLVSSDGSVVIGYGFPPDARIGPKPFRWTAETGLEQLSTLGDSIDAIAMSADGGVVVGDMRSLRPDVPRFETYNDPFVWTAKGGLQKLRDVLVAGGATDVYPLDIDDMIHFVSAVSDDGRRIRGSSVRITSDSSGQVEVTGVSWIADISPVPEPATVVFALAVVLTATISRRRPTSAPPRD